MQNVLSILNYYLIVKINFEVYRFGANSDGISKAKMKEVIFVFLLMSKIVGYLNS